MTRYLVTATWLFVAAATAADTVHLTNGDRISGTLVGLFGELITFETDYAGTLVLKRSAVASLQTDAEFDVTDAQGNRARAVVTPDLDIAATRSIRQNYVAGVSFVRSLENHLELATQVSTGNSETESYKVLWESKYRRGTVQHEFDAVVDYEEADDEATKDQSEYDYAIKWFYRPDWYLAGNGEYFSDKLKDVDGRITVGAGIGHQFWDDTYGALSAEIGVSQVFEDVAGEDESNPAIRWGLDYNRFFFGKRLELFHSQEFLFIADSGRGEVYDASVGLRYKLSDRISANTRIDLRHETEPPPDAEKTDVTYAIGAGIHF